MVQENVGFIIEGLLKELASGVPPETVLLEIGRNKALGKIFAERPHYQLIDSLQEKDLKTLLEGFLTDVKGEVSETITEDELVQKVRGVDMAKQASEAKAASVGHHTLGNIKERRRAWIGDVVKNYTKFSPKTREELIKTAEALPLAASGADIERTIEKALSGEERSSREAQQLTAELSQKQEEAAAAATAVASAITSHKGPRPDIFATILDKKIEAQNPQDASDYKTIIEQAAPLSRVYEAVTSASEGGGHKDYFSLWLSNNPGSKPIDDRYKAAPGSPLPGSPKEHAEIAGVIVSSAAERILKNPELRAKLRPDEIELLRRVGERGFTPKKITATKWLAQILTTPPSDSDFKKVNESIFSMFELKRLGLLPTSAFSPGAPRVPGQTTQTATLVERYTVWHPLVLFYATIAQTNPEELVFASFGGPGQWIISWAAQKSAEAGAARLAIQTSVRGVGSKTISTVFGGALGGPLGFVAGWFGSDVLMRAGGRFLTRARGWFGVGGKADAWSMEGVLLPLILVLAPLFIVFLSAIALGPVLTAFGVTSPYSGAGGAAPGGPTTNASYGGLASLGSFNQFNTNNVSGIYTSRGATRPLTDSEQTKIAAAVKAFGSFAVFAAPLGTTKINLTAFPTTSPDGVIGLAPPSQAGNIALYQDAFGFSDETLGRLLAHELTHQIEWFRPDVYNAFVRGTTAVARGYCGPLGTYVKGLPETSEETFAEAAAMYIIGDPRLKDPNHQGTCGGNTYAFVDAMFAGKL